MASQPLTKNLKNLALSCSLLCAGYFAGATSLFAPVDTAAQPPGSVATGDIEPEVPLSPEAVKQIQSINETMAQAMETLRIEGRYNTATLGINPYLILTGGGDAMDDLEQGNGVDPYTFAELYAGLATKEVGDEITVDEQNRLLYKNRLIRIYSVEQLKQRYDTYQKILAKRVGQ